MKQDTCEKDPKVSASIFFFQLLARPPCPAGFILCRDGWVRGCIRTPAQILQKFVLRAEPWLYAQKEPSLPPLNWGTRVWTTRPARAGVSCKRLCFWGALCFHVPVPPPPPGRLPCLVFWNNYFFPFFTQLLSSALSLTLRLATWAMPAIFTDSSHQPICFPLPQTVTFFETIL